MKKTILALTLLLSLNLQADEELATPKQFCTMVKDGAEMLMKYRQYNKPIDEALEKVNEIIPDNEMVNEIFVDITIEAYGYLVLRTMEYKKEEIERFSQRNYIECLKEFRRRGESIK